MSDGTSKGAQLGSSARVSDWIATRTPAAPDSFRPLLDAQGPATFEGLLDAAGQAMERVLALEGGGCDRRQAEELLVLDAYIAYAAEAALEEEGSEDRLRELIRLMARAYPEQTSGSAQ